jgi:hypothetical protein
MEQDEQISSSERPRTKIAVVLRDDLETWQAINVTAFLVSGLPSAEPELLGLAYQDADDVTYLPMFRQPVLVLRASAEVLTAAHGRALAREMPISVFTADLFSTGGDEDNRAAVRAVKTEKLDLVGIAMHGGKNQVDKIVKGTEMYR